ncbi:PVC-type heme-binding CxxCH protein [uncultured Kriegella sp.]|uniref:PVC-type heme-binding CxxCH protein n=1 Tax=uncultured Kriegella sp. TaxID=1798910 RepID=UPI0030D763C7|tara:strand:+ start:8462 stop:11584 length:3123 start_codon:yes stop_codon:yes gene_type:complete
MSSRNTGKTIFKSTVRHFQKGIALLFVLAFALYGCRKAIDKEQGRSLKEIADNEEVADHLTAFEGRGALTDGSEPTPAEEAIKQFEVSPDLELDLVLSEPSVYQPVEISFDTKGRLWVVQYNQYPYPAGLKIKGIDNHLRVQFDKMPEAPPKGNKGADKITVFEDTDGNGSFDKSTDVITGLNIATSVTLGRKKIWVLNPPYLLAYPDVDGDGIPDGDPEVHLEGFGIQDTHAAANSLRWGPDGWLYGAQGSTTTSNISSTTTKNVFFRGQAIWRYHPETKVFEIFSEGGGNTFNVEFDSKGNLFSGHNGVGRGPYFKQGAYYRKSWGKHGSLTNPYAFGYLGDMGFEGDNVRFTHAILRYESGELPSRFEGNFIALNPLQGDIVMSNTIENGSSLRTIDQEKIVDTKDLWFRPIDMQAGPDGNLYISDWYDSRLSHVDPNDTWYKKSGRVYRLRKEGGEMGYESFDISRYSNNELIALLHHKNRWFRQKALQVIGEKKDISILPDLIELFRTGKNQVALEALWAIHLIGEFNDEIAIEGLRHKNPFVRLWSVRLLGDREQLSANEAKALVAVSLAENHVEVRSQLAATAKRVKGSVALEIIKGLLLHHDDSKDPDIPLQIWWALESKAESNSAEVIEMFRNKQIWEVPLVRQVLLNRLVQRYMMSPETENYVTATELFKLAVDEETGSSLMKGLEEGLRGNSYSDLPAELLKAIGPYKLQGEGKWAMALRQKDEQVKGEVLRAIADSKTDIAERQSYIRILGQGDYPEFVPILLKIIGRSETEESKTIKIAVLNTLQNYNVDSIGQTVLRLYPNVLRENPDVRSTALNLLVSRSQWAASLLDEIDEKLTIDKSDVLIDLVHRIKLLGDKRLVERSEKIWPESIRSTATEKMTEIKRYINLVASGKGNADNGKSVYQNACSACHRLFEQGGSVGPELTGYERRNYSNMISQIVDPSADIREGYTSYILKTKDGRTIVGFLTSRSEKNLSVKPYGGERMQFSMDQILSMEPEEHSMMPEGILDKLTNEEVKDLFAYIMKKE